MRLPLIALLLSACTDPPAPPPAADSGPPPPPSDELLWVEAGTYRIDWYEDDLGLDCDRLVIDTAIDTVTLLAGDEPCMAPLPVVRRAVNTAACVPGPVEGTRDWCINPGVGRLLASIRWQDTSLAASMYLFPE